MTRASRPALWITVISLLSAIVRLCRDTICCRCIAIITMQSDLDSDTLDTLYKRLVKHVKKETVIIPGVAEIKTKKGKPKTAQEKIDEFWVKFNSKAPGKGSNPI
jgi:hypothetical protein